MLSGLCGRFQENLFGDLWGCVRTGPNKSEMLCVISVGAHLSTASAEHLAHLRLCLRFLQEALLKRSPEGWTLRARFTHCWVYLRRLSSSCSCDVFYIAGPLKLSRFRFSFRSVECAADSDSRECARRLVLLQGCSSLRREATQPRTRLDETSLPRAPRAQGPPSSDSLFRADRCATAGPRLKAQRSKPPSLVYMYIYIYIYVFCIT